MNDPKASAMTGRCLCGAVSYKVTAPLLMAGDCYCTSCRKLSGAGHAMHALVADAALDITGATRDFDWVADSGNTVTTSFCPTCGSPLFGKSSGMPGMKTFRVASLDDPSGVAPEMAVYTKRLLPWDHLDPKLPAFAEMPPPAPAG